MAKATILLVACLFLVVIGSPASAETPVSNQQANAFYRHCITQSAPRLSESSQDALCSCTTVKMQETMQVEYIDIMKENTPRGQAMLNYMLLNVYAPCIAYPAHDLVYQKCLTDSSIDALDLKADREGLCSCMAERTGLWLSKEGQDIMTELLIDNPDLPDPISPVIESDVFQKSSYQNLVACLVQ